MKRKLQVRAVFFVSANDRSTRWSESSSLAFSPSLINVQDPGPCLSSATLLHVRTLYLALRPGGGWANDLADAFLLRGRLSSVGGNRSSFSNSGRDSPLSTMSPAGNSSTRAKQSKRDEVRLFLLLLLFFERIVLRGEWVGGREGEMLSDARREPSGSSVLFQTIVVEQERPFRSTRLL